MQKLKKRIFNIILGILILSSFEHCNNSNIKSNNQIAHDSLHNNIVRVDTEITSIDLTKASKGKGKFFLDFWYGMSDREFYQMEKKLQLDTILDVSAQKYYFQLGTDKNTQEFEVLPFFNSDGLIYINLKNSDKLRNGELDCNYIRQLICQKYGDNPIGKISSTEDETLSIQGINEGYVSVCQRRSFEWQLKNKKIILSYLIDNRKFYPIDNRSDFERSQQSNEIPNNIYSSGSNDQSKQVRSLSKDEIQERYKVEIGDEKPTNELRVISELTISYIPTEYEIQMNKLDSLSHIQELKKLKPLNNNRL